MITTSEVAVSVTIDSDANLDAIVQELEPFGNVEIDKDHTIVSIVGNDIAQTPDVMKKVFEAISSIPVRMVSYGGSSNNISLLIPAKHKKETLQLINKGVFGL